MATLLLQSEEPQVRDEIFKTLYRITRLYIPDVLYKYYSLDISEERNKQTLDTLFKKLFGEETETRFHPSYYQFTEPSVEVDITCHKCHGKGCNICKNSGWITVVGAGIVHPNVLKMSGYDPNIWTGFAFGFGADRLAMEKYDIHDLRAIYNTDLRETKVFDRKEAE